MPCGVSELKTFLVQVMACHLFGAKTLPKPMQSFCQLNTWEQTLVKLSAHMFIQERAFENVSKTVFYTKGRPLVKSNLIYPSDKLSWQPGCPF